MNIYRSCGISTRKQIWLPCSLYSWQFDIIHGIRSQYIQYISEYADGNVRYYWWFWIWFDLFTSGCCCRLLLRNETIFGYGNCCMWFRCVHNSTQFVTNCTLETWSTPHNQLNVNTHFLFIYNRFWNICIRTIG